DTSLIQTLRLPEAALADEEEEDDTVPAAGGELPPIVPYSESADGESGEEIAITEREGPPEMHPDEAPPWEEAGEDFDDEEEDEEDDEDEIAYRIPPSSLLSPPY